MTKAKERSLRAKIIKHLKDADNYKPTDDFLIQELLDFLSMSEFAKQELKANPSGWGEWTKVSMASNQIQAIMTKLSLTPATRLKKKKDDEKDKPKTGFNLAEFMNS
jgi:hypothetical protein